MCACKLVRHVISFFASSKSNMQVAHAALCCSQQIPALVRFWSPLATFFSFFFFFLACFGRSRVSSRTLSACTPRHGGEGSCVTLPHSAIKGRKEVNVHTRAQARANLSTAPCPRGKWVTRGRRKGNENKRTNRKEWRTLPADGTRGKRVPTRTFISPAAADWF